MRRPNRCRYCIIVLHADDNGQGGTFALFSILKRQAELGKRGEVQTWHFTAHIVVASVRQWSRFATSAQRSSDTLH